MRRCVTAGFRLLSGALPPGIRAAGVRAPHRLVDARTRQVIALLLLAENAAFATPTVDGVDGDAMTIDVEHLAPELLRTGARLRERSRLSRAHSPPVSRSLLTSGSAPCSWCARASWRCDVETESSARGRRAVRVSHPLRRISICSTVFITPPLVRLLSPRSKQNTGQNAGVSVGGDGC